MIGTKLAHYEITSHLGSGGMGDVYQATDSRLGRNVAVKFLPEAFSHDSERVARFEREARVLASLNHSNIAAIHGLEEFGERKFLVMELVSGDTLADRIKRGPIPIEEALQIAKQIGDALEAAHEKGIVHRDLKPGNVKITPEGKVKVLDFGLAKAYEPDSSNPALSNSPTISMAATNVGVILGTAAYMAPEQAKGKAVDKRADIWAFGVVLYEMLTGERLFKGEDMSEVLASVIKEQPVFEKIPPHVRPLLEGCLEKDANKRLRDIGDAWRLLGRDREALPDMPVVPGSVRSRFGYVAWVLAGLAMLMAVGIGFVHFREAPPVQQIYSFQIAPPPNTRFTTFRLSPDGRYVAYIAVGGQTTGAGEGGLWIHELDSLESRQVPGSEGSSYPFWSPDSTFIGFFQGGKLKKVGAAGGPAQTICDVAASRGGAWGPDGTILFTDGPARPIFRVYSSGGKPAQLTTLTGGDPGEGHRSPEFLPDGRHFLFNASGNNPDNSGIQLGSLDGSAPMRLLPDDSNGIYIPRTGAAGGRNEGGHVFFLRDGTLMALPFDPARRKATAEAFPVAENVAIAANQRYGAFSLAGNGTLAYWGGGLANSRELVWMDRSGKRLSPLGKPGAFSNYALSPDEKTVAASVGNFPQSDIWLLDSASGSITRFTFGFTGSDPVWSPDGRSIVYARRNGVTNDIVRRQITGGAEELLLAGIVNGMPRDVSSEGKFIVHDMSVAKTAFDIGLLSADGDHRESAYLSSPANEREPVISPDGKWMAYQSDESGQFQVYVQTIPAGSGKFQISTSGGTIPAWSHDGTELYYLASDQKLTAVPVKINGASFEPGTPQALFTATGASHFAVTRDGQRFLMNVPAGGESVAAGPPLTIVTNWQAGLKK
jgi:eukaryotic-like serine/threonine-protein kinase